MTFPSFVQCPSCGASVPTSTQTCPACGFPLAEILAQTSRNPETIRQLAEDLNQDLVKSATTAAETAFGVSCTLAALLIGLLLVVIYLAVSRALTVLFVAAFLGLLLAIMVAALLATRAKNATLEKTYRRVSAPRIEAYLQASGLSRREFCELAAREIGEGAPLLSYLKMDSMQEQS